MEGLKENILLKDYTTYKIGGPARYFFEANNLQALEDILKLAKEMRLPLFVLGGGSNILVSDKGFNGLVIKISILDKNIIDINKIYAGAGATLKDLAYFSSEHGLSGLEWSAGIPEATIGGAIYGSAQAFGTKISSIVKEVQALDLKDYKIKKFTNKQCLFSLKNSIFKKQKNLIIISCILEFQQKNSDEIIKKINEFLDYRRLKHPALPSPGSAFVNPEIKIKNKNLLKKFPELENFNKVGIIPAGYLIAKSGLSGKIKGGAQISMQHSNFIVNMGNAKAKDVVFLLKLAHKKVNKIFGINLEPEVQFIGFPKNHKI